MPAQRLATGLRRRRLQTTDHRRYSSDVICLADHILCSSHGHLLGCGGGGSTPLTTDAAAGSLRLGDLQNSTTTCASFYLLDYCVCARESK